MDIRPVVEEAVEVRVHGVGDHDWSSLLGRPRILDDGGPDVPSVLAPPTSPDHSLVLFNWSRVTRNTLPILWYLAFPYTLLNVAYQMRPPYSKRAQIAHAASVHLASLGLTIVTTVWVLGLFERSSLWLPREQVINWQLPRVAMWIGCLLLVGAVLWKSRGGSKLHVWSAAVHASVITALTLTVDILRPQLYVIDLDSFFIAHAIYRPSPESIEQIDAYFASNPGPTDYLRVEQLPYLDVLSLTTWACLGIAFITALVPIMATPSESDHSPAFGTAACILGGYLLSILTLSALLGRIPALIVRLGNGLPQGGVASSEIPVTRLTNTYGGMSRAGDALPVVALLFLLVPIIIALALARFRAVRFTLGVKFRAWVGMRLSRPSWKNSAERIRGERLKWSHVLITEKLPSILLRTFAITFALFLAAEFVLLREIMSGVYRDDALWFIEFSNGAPTTPAPQQTIGDRVFAIGAIVAVGSAFWMLRTGASGLLRPILAKVGDVAGFWPVSVSPLGGRPYRPTVSKALTARINLTGPESTVLVAHSQGSVLAAWHIATQQVPVPLRALVTCGSPLLSLYRRFFPATFSPEFFAKVSLGSASWTNIWRHTDPIGTTIPQASLNIQLEDPNSELTTFEGHGNYWSDPRQMAAVAQLIDGTR